MINRKAEIYTDYKKTNLKGIGTVLYIGQVGDTEGGVFIAASVELETGEVIEVEHDKLKFIDGGKK